jgi:DNA-binding response OmpR family regulator
LTAGDLCLDVNARQVIKNGHVHRLTPKQCALLETFMTHRGQVLTRKFLMQRVWNTDYTGDTRTLEVHVSWVRKYIEDDPRQPTHLRTVHRVGYRFDCED